MKQYNFFAILIEVSSYNPPTMKTYRVSHREGVNGFGP